MLAGYMFGKTYLAGADFIESHECERLREHGAGEVFLGQEQGHHDEREQNLWHESEGFDVEGGV